MAYFVQRILFLGAVVFITASANLMMEYNWPEPDRNINRFPHESSCHYYYLMLSEEDISLEKCPDGQLFDYAKHNCISEKEHIHCWSRHFGKMKHDHGHMKHKKHFKCPYPWGKYPNLHDCSKYHLCLHGKSRMKKCAQYELFDKISRKCIASIDAVCADKTDIVESDYICPKAYGSFTHSKDCSKYYECLQKKATVRTCQKGRLFDDRLRKCAPQDHVYCGLRRNPYEKDVPETSSITSDQQSTTSCLDVTVTTLIEETKSVGLTSQEIKSTPLETSSTLKEIPSTPQETSSAIKEVPSTPEEISPTFLEVTSTEASTNQPTSIEISKPSEIDDKKAKQESSIATTVIEKSEIIQNTNGVTENINSKKLIVETSPTTEEELVKIATDDESDLIKDVSTEEIDTDIASITDRTSESSTDSRLASSKTLCFPGDSMCLVEKDGTVVKCSNSKDLQPHPKDERRYLDCSESKIYVRTCPIGLIFRPDIKKCKYQFIMK